MGRGEIDLHVLVGRTSVAVEVKTRLDPVAGFGPLGAFTEKKAAAVRRYARLLDPPTYRVDLVAVTLGSRDVEVLWVPYAT